MRRLLFWLQRKKRKEKRQCAHCCLLCSYYKDCIGDGEF